MTHLKIGFFAFFTFLLSLTAVGSQAEVHYYLFIDSMHIYLPQDVQRLYPNKFEEITNTNLNVGLTDKEHWLVVSVKNSGAESLHGKLVVDYSLLNEIHFYELNHSKIVELPQRFSSRSYKYDIRVQSDTESLFLLHVNSDYTPGIIPVSFYENNAGAKSEYLETFWIGNFYGILLFLLLLIMLMNVVSKERLSRIILVYLFFTLLYFSLRDGFIIKFGLGIGAGLQLRLVLMVIPILVVLFDLFMIKYFKELEIAFSNRTKTKILHLTSAIVMLIIISNLFTFKVSFFLTAIYTIVWLPIIIFPTITPENLKKSTILPIIVSTIFLFGGFTIDALHKVGWLENSFFTQYIFKFSFLAHIGILLMGAVSRFQALRLRLHHFNDSLGEKIQAKTAEINQQNEELTVQTEQLEYQKEELQAQKEELETQKEILQDQNLELEILDLAVSNTQNVIYLFDPQGVLIWFNTSFSSQLGKTLKEYKSSNEKIKICDISSYEKIREAVARVIQTRESMTYEAQVVVDGQNRWFQTTLTPVIEANELKNIVAIDTEITRLKNYEQEIITQQRDFEMQKNLAIVRRKEVELQQREITDSLNYAKRIQSAILPSAKSISRFFPESFVLFMPRDIVSGDFYWFHRIEDKYICVVVDCTGHGVPGAFMSIIGTYLLNNIIIQNNETRPAEILKQLNRKLKISLKNSAMDSQTNDGMDVALAVVDKASETLTYAGSLRPLFLFQNGKFIEQKGDKVPITSAISGNTMASFNEYTYKINDGDSFYIFSDGIVDQFGGQKNKKFLTKRLKQVLFDAQMYNMEEQKKIIQKSIIDWKGKNQQIDDILLVGVQI
jgi:PAS domain S-box-containing protein